MKKIADYEGTLLSHVESLYRPGERELAIELVEALGCVVSDTGFKGDGADTFLAVHPNPDDQDVQNNAFYMSQIRPEQLLVEERLKQVVAQDQALAEAMEAYRQVARSKPFGVPHFSLRYKSRSSIEAAEARLKAGLLPKLKDRAHLRIFYPEDADAAVGISVQGFLYQDVVVSGSFMMGQIIELQAPA
jgi:hypothetical protein